MRRSVTSTQPLDRYNIKDAAVIVEGDIVALDAAIEANPAADTAALKVVGIAQTISDDGLQVEVVDGIFEFDNSASHPFTRANRGATAYVEDKDTVASDGGTNSIVAGIVIDVTDDGVIVDTRPAAIAAA